MIVDLKSKFDSVIEQRDRLQAELAESQRAVRNLTEEVALWKENHKFASNLADDLTQDGIKARTELAAVKAERDHLQNGFNAAVATVQVRDARIAQLEAALQPFLLKPPQTHQIDILSRPQPVWWDCICGISNSLDSCGHCCRSRPDTKRETKE